MMKSSMDEGQVLESWKEISAFLGRDVRTCMRWERDLGLPIHRLDGSPRARVFAFRDELDAWLSAKLHEHDGEHGPAPAAATRRRLLPALRTRVIVLAVVLVLAAAAIVYRALVPAPPPPLPPGYVQPVVAVLVFENKSGDPALDPWRDSLAELLVADLSQSRYIRVVRTDEMLTVLRRLGLDTAPAYSSEDIARIALHTRAGYVVRGSYVKAGASFVITTGLNKVGPAGPAPPDLQVVARSENDVIRKINALARGVKKSLSLTRAQIVYDFAKEAQEALTPSPQALRLYVEGRRADLSNRWKDAVAALEQAIRIDPEFAMAYRALAQVQYKLDNLPESWAALEQSLAHPVRLPPGEERFIRGQLAYYRQDYATAIPLFRDFLAEHPGNLNAMWYLAYAHNSVGDLDKSIELQGVVTRERNSVLDVRTLAYYLQRKGRYQEATELCLSFIQNVEDSWRVRQVLAVCYAFLGEFDLAVAEAQKNFRSVPDAEAAQTGANMARNLADILSFKGDLAGAEAVVGPERFALDRGRFEARVDDMRGAVEKAMAGGRGQEEVGALWYLAQALEKAGRYAEAWAAFSDFLKLAGPAGLGNETVTATGTGYPYFPSQRKRDLTVVARLQVEMGQIEAARATAAELKAAIEAGIVERDVRFYEYVLGLIELARGVPLEAVGHLQRACALLYSEDFLQYDEDPAYFYDALARAQFEAGDMAGARKTCEKITSLTTGRRNDGDLYTLAIYRLGRIAERQGEGAAARGYFRKFLVLWKDADPGRPEVADAKARLGV